jgi:hypothetical protein
MTKKQNKSLSKSGSPARKTMFTTVPRPRSEKKKRTIVATTKNGYLEAGCS